MNIQFEQPSWCQILYISIAYVYGIFICGSFIKCIMINLRENNPRNKSVLERKEPLFFALNTVPEPDNPELKYDRNQSAMLGYIERVLYVFSYQFFPPFIAAWLTLKTISHWSKWSEKDGRIEFNNFLIGNGLSLFSSFIAYLLIRVALDLSPEKVLCPYVILLSASILFLSIMLLLAHLIKGKTHAST